MKKLFPIALILMMGLFGLLAISIGFKLAAEDKEVSISAYKELATLADDGTEFRDIDAKNQIPSSVLFNIYHKLSSSSKYTYGEGSYLEAYESHSHRQGIEKVSLYVHIILGGLVLITGSFQFWVWFRRRYKKAHRILGLVYILACTGMGVFIFIYLSKAGIVTTHEEYIGFLGLHLLNLTTVIPVFLSMFFLYKKDFGKHVGWMSLSFGSILTAPFQRTSWGILASLNLGETHAVLNSIVDTYLFAMCYIFGYILFCINRFYSPLKKSFYKTSSSKPLFKGLIYAFCAVGSITIIYHYLLTAGMADSVFANLVIGNEIIQSEKSVVFDQKLLPSFYAVLNTIAIIAGGYLLTTSKTEKKLGLVSLLLSTITIALIEFYWGYRLGIPHELHAVGGTHYFFWGVLHLFFVALILIAMKTKSLKPFLGEWSMFLWLLLFAAPIRYWLIYLHGLFIDVIPPVYIQGNHVHQFIAALPMAILAIIGLIASIYSKHTRSRAIY